MSLFRTLAVGLIGAVLGGVVAPASAQFDRHFPPEAKRAVMTPPTPGGVVTLDGERKSLAPGAAIRDQDNRIVLPAMLQTSVRVKFLLDPAGLVHRVWILTEDEIARPDPPTPLR